MNDTSSNPNSIDTDMPFMITTADILWGVPRLKDLMFSRQLDADATLGQHPLAPKVNLLLEEFSDNTFEELQQGSFALANDGQSVLSQAMERVRMRLRLAYDLEVYTSIESCFPGKVGCGIRRENTIHIFLSQPFLDITDARELSFHLALYVWEALDPGAWFARVLGHFPLHQVVTEDMNRRYRYAVYSGAIYGLLACGDLDIAIRESWRVYSSLHKPIEAPMLLEMSARACADGDTHYWERQLNEAFNARYPLLLPTVLREFTRTDICASLFGTTAGLTNEPKAVKWADFEAQVLELDDRVHTPSENWTEKLSAAVTLIQPLATAWMLESHPDFSTERILELLDRTCITDEDLREFFNEQGWQPGAEGNTAELLNRYLYKVVNVRRLPFANANILSKMAIIVCIETARIVDSSPSEEEQRSGSVIVDRFVEFASLCGIAAEFANHYLTAMMEKLQAEAE